MKITLMGISVDDQEKALKFYTEILGFVKKQDIPVGEYRWLTVISPEGHDDVELALEPNANPASQAFQKALREQGIPCTSFESADVRAECERLKAKGVEFTTEPKEAGSTVIATFSDTCGNLIQMHQG